MSSAELCTGVHGEALGDESFRGPLVDAVAVQTLRDKACGGLGGAGDWKLWAGFHSLCFLVSCCLQTAWQCPSLNGMKPKPLLLQDPEKLGSWLPSLFFSW